MTCWHLRRALLVLLLPLGCERVLRCLIEEGVPSLAEAAAV